jgi:putative salt-induced outer membrane protein YdiY
LGASIGRAEDAPKLIAPPPLDKDVVKDWNGSIALGLNISKGNSDTLMFNAAAVADKLWKSDEWHFGADGAYGLNDWGHSNETTSANNIHGVIGYRHLFTERFYGGAGVEFLHDDVAAVRYRVILSPGVGYYFIKSPATRLRGEAGPAFIIERVQGADHDRVALRFAGRLEHDLTKTAKYWGQIEYLPAVDDFGNYLLNSEIGIEAAINTHFSLRTVAQDKFNSRAPSDKERNDLTIIAALVYKFGQVK